MAWFLEGLIDERATAWRTELTDGPFLVGRAAESALKLRAPGISHRHAELFSTPEEVIVRDLGSTNGTFVNLERVEQARLNEGDLLHFADQEFRLVRFTDEAGFRSTMALDMKAIRAAREERRQRPELERMIRGRQFSTLFQPLVRLDDRRRVGFEMLGRGAAEGLPELPAELFAAAEIYDLELPLSHGLRRTGQEDASRLPHGLLFVNTHPVEMDYLDQLQESLVELRRSLPQAELVLEIHELAVTDVEALKPFRQRLEELEVGLALDDFGKGRTRFLELAELSPRFLKFDRALVANLDRESGKRREMIRVLVDMVRDLNVLTLAEGVEREEEAQACRDLGFEFAQGYLFGKPLPADAYVARTIHEAP